MSSDNVVVQDVTLHEIFARSSSSWCKLMWDDSGWVIILSDYGHWAYHWGNRGNESVAKFLVSLDSHYMGKKLLGQAIDEFSLDQTIASVRNHILQLRRDGDFTADHAREEWDSTCSLECGDIGWEEWCNQTSLQDAWDWRTTKINSCWAMFWKRLWVPLVVPVLRNHPTFDVAANESQR